MDKLATQKAPKTLIKNITLDKNQQKRKKI